MKWIRLMGGVVTIRVRGAELERFLNACMRDGIQLRCIRRREIDELTAQLSVRDFFRLRGSLRRAHCHIRFCCAVCAGGMHCGRALCCCAR